MNQRLFIFVPERSHRPDKQSLESEEDEEGKTSDCSQELTVVAREQNNPVRSATLEIRGTRFTHPYIRARR